MPIRYYEGVEGAGKTAMLTRDLSLHYKYGGQVLVFPGYELYGINKKDIISETLLPEQWITFPETLRRKKIAIGIDEVTNFFNNHVWYNKICDMMAALMAERRKFEVAILMTGPIFNRLPPVIREMVHEIVHCQDLHTLNHGVPRGEKCIYYKEDLRGLLSNPRRRFTRKKVFHTKPWWPKFDTYAAVDFLHQFIRVKIKSREIIINADGKVATPISGIPNIAELDGIISKYSERHTIEDEKTSKVKEVLSYLIKKGITRPTNSLICDMLKVPHLGGRGGVGSIITSLGGVYKQGKENTYDLSCVSLS